MVDNPLLFLPIIALITLALSYIWIIILTNLLPSMISIIKLSEEEKAHLVKMRENFHERNPGNNKKSGKLLYRRFPLMAQGQFVMQYDNGICSKAIFLNVSNLAFIPYSIYDKVVRYPISHFENRPKYHNLHIETADGRIIEIDGRYHDVQMIMKNIKNHTDGNQIEFVDLDRPIPFGRICKQSKF